MTRAWKLLAAGALVAIVAAGAVRLLVPGPTDEQRIRLALADAAAALGERRVGDAMGLVSERFEGKGLDRRALRGVLVREVLRGAWTRVVAVPAEVRVQDDGAEVALVAAALRGGEGGEVPVDGTALRVRCTLAREDGTWRVVRAEWERAGAAEVLDALRGR